MLKNKAFLASQSPRRHEISSYLFENIEILSMSHQEPPLVPGAPETYLKACVRSKKEAALRLCEDRYSMTQRAGRWLLVADTLVSFRGKLLGKPRDPQEAYRMLQTLSGQTHEVYTGFELGLWAKGGKNLNSLRKNVCTRVRFHSLSAREIREYVSTGDPMDKAGAYGFQGRALRFVASIQGSYTNVMGLPLEDLRATARALMREQTGRE